MSSFYEQEMRKLFEDGTVIDSPRFLGPDCLGTLGRDLRVRATLFETSLQVVVLNRGEGEVDKISLGFTDILGMKKIPDHPTFRNGLHPHIWTYEGKTEWYGYQPTAADYQTLRAAVDSYLEMFRSRETVRESDGPKLVYICAPLHGDVERNIEFASQKAQEVFQAGNIPVCPHIMLPSLADPENVDQYLAAQRMSLRLVESCQQVNVYGTVLSERMWAEIDHAILRGISVKSDVEAIQRAQTHRQAAAQKGKGRRKEAER